MFLKLIILSFFLINSLVLYGNELQIKFFGTKNCSDCERIELGVLQEVVNINKNLKIEKKFIDTVENFEDLLLHEKLYGSGSNSNATVKIYIGYFPNDVQCLSGVADIENNLHTIIKEYENKLLVSKNIIENPSEQQLSHKISLKQFSIMPLLIAGFLDGLNPCVFSSIIFLLGLLSVAGVINLKLLWVGIAFCCGSFVSYTLLGLLFFYIMDIMNELQIIKIIFKYIFIFLLVFFAIVSISNAYKIKKNLILYGQSCKLPSPLVKKIHAIMKKNATSKILVMGGFLSGLCATFFESLCTGQVYIPSLAYIIKMDIAKIHSFCYIILYNLSCITPLLIIFILIYKGMQFSKIEEFLDNNQFYKNVILAFVFLIIASIMYIL